MSTKLLRQLEKSTSIKYFLVDNGSFRAESVLYIRDVARQLSKVSGKTVEPAGIMHSHKVDSLKLNGIPACRWRHFFNRRGQMKPCVNFIPMFLGPSLAITDWLKVKADEWIAAKTGREYKIVIVYSKMEMKELQMPFMIKLSSILESKIR